MARSLAHRLATVSLTLCAVAPALALSACAPTEANGGSTLRFAVSAPSDAVTQPSAPAVRVGSARVLSRRVNLLQPLELGALGGNVTVTFAVRQLDGTTLSLDPESLAERGAIGHAYPPHAKHAAPPLSAPGAATVSLASGGAISCWTDDESGRVLAQVFRSDGTWIGSPVAVSPEGMDVFGAPRLVAAGGRRAVAAFFVSTEEGFRLVAVSLERVR
jgi:hypothetical protein